MKVLAIVDLCLAAAGVYGIVHDQITARVCVEYFTVGHPRILAKDDPTILGLVWGVLATWWVGLLLGVPLAVAARAGAAAKREPASMIRPILTLLAIMALVAGLAGVTGGLLARRGVLTLVGELASGVPPAHHSWFIADQWAHGASYATGFVGGVVLVTRTWASRRRAASANVSIRA